MFDNNRLRQMRLDRDLTLEEVGKRVGITRSAVLKYEKGSIKNIYISIVESFAKALHCSPAYLMCWTDDPLFNIEKSQNFTNSFSKLDTEDRGKVLGFIDGLLQSDKYK